MIIGIKKIKEIINEEIDKSIKDLDSELKKTIINEIKSLMQDSGKKLPDSMYGGLDNAIRDSNFWTYSNTEDEADMENVKGEWHNQTPAAGILGFGIEEYFKKIGVPITIVVISAEIGSTRDIKLPVTTDHSLYPNKIVVGGQQGVDSRGRFVMYLFIVPVDENFNPGDVDPGVISRNIGNIVRHEIIHAKQIEKRKLSQGLTRVAAKDKFEDEGEIVDSDDRQSYLSAGIEIDAYAHEFAEKLLQTYGKEKSLEILRGSVPIDDLDLPDQFKEYLENVPGENLSNKLKSKMYTHIIDLTDREIYETKKKKKKKKKKYGGSQPEDTYKKATVKNMYMDKDSSHGGWPDGPSKSFTSNEPVMKQISSWMKSMKLLD